MSSLEMAIRRAEKEDAQEKSEFESALAAVTPEQLKQDHGYVSNLERMVGTKKRLEAFRAVHREIAEHTALAAIAAQTEKIAAMKTVLADTELKAIAAEDFEAITAVKFRAELRVAEDRLAALESGYAQWKANHLAKVAGQNEYDLEQALRIAELGLKEAEVVARREIVYRTVPKFYGFGRRY